ncbi:ATP-dependent helicase HrpB, partial [human gut metagenome]
MPEQRLPEILDADLSSMVLDIAAFGENKPELLPWLTLPPKGNLVLAQQLLMSLNALTPDH